MSRDTVVLSMAVSDSRASCRGEPDFEQRLIKAMKATYRHWILTDEGQQYMVALASAMLESEGDDAKQIERLIKLEQALGAACSGVPVDFGALGAGTDLPSWPCRPVHELWAEVKGQ